MLVRCDCRVGSACRLARINIYLLTTLTFPLLHRTSPSVRNTMDHRNTLSGGVDSDPSIHGEDARSMDGDTYVDDYSASDHDGSDFEPEREPEELGEDFVEEIVEFNRPKMPLPPTELFHHDPEAFIMEFMFLPRPGRMREADLDFSCLHWKPITREILVKCCGYISIKLTMLMNEDAELERDVKGMGARRTAVLSKNPYDAITAELIRKEKWSREDVIYCICEGMKRFPRELSRNQRFKARLNLPVPGKDYDVVLGVVRDEVNERSTNTTRLNNQKKSDIKDKTNKADKAAPAANRTTQNKRGGASTAKEVGNGQAKSSKKRGVKDDSSESEFNTTNASPKKKGRATTKKATAATASASTSKLPVTPSRSRSAASTAVADSSSKRTPRGGAGGLKKHGVKPEKPGTW